MNRCSIAFGEPAVVAKGITLYPGGNPVYLTYEDWEEALCDPVSAIFETAGETLGFVELLE